MTPDTPPSPPQEHVELAALANLGAWGQVSSWTFGRAWPGVGAALVAMIAAQRAGSIEALPPSARGLVRVLTWPGSVAVAEASKPSEPWCSGCAEGSGCDNDLR